MIRTLAALCGFWMVMSCRPTPEFVVKGVIAGAEGQTMFLENVGLASIVLMDSVRLDASGSFMFKKPRPEYPDFYRFRLNNQLINFAIDSTETITITADAVTFATSYTIEGSENCTAIKEITLAQLDANQSINRLRKDYQAGIISDSTYTQQTIAIAETYKGTAKKYIYSKPMSTAAYFALFQQVDGMLFYDLYDRTDSRAYGAVATSFNNFYPESPRAKHLYNLALQSLKVIRGERRLELDDLKANAVDYFDIELSDIRGNQIKLSDMAKDHIVLLNFTAYQTEWGPILNLTLGSLYAKYHDRGLEIYQVSLDEDLHAWRNIASNLAWICVRDPQSIYSQAAAMYNVRQLPAVFIINRKGTLEKRIDDINNLEKDIHSMFE